MPSLAAYCKDYLWRDTTAIMNLYPPLRLHPMTRGAINNIVLKHKKLLLTHMQAKLHAQAAVTPEVEAMRRENPMWQDINENDAAKEEEEEESIYYYGLLLMDTTVVTIFKSNQDIQVAPQDISLILTFLNVTYKRQQRHRKDNRSQTQFFEEMCLPGMTQDFRLPVFFKFFDENKHDQTADEKGRKQPEEVKAKSLKIVFVCEEKNQDVEQQLSQVADGIFNELIFENLYSFLKQSEYNMYKKYGKSFFLSV